MGDFVAELSPLSQLALRIGKGGFYRQIEPPQANAYELMFEAISCNTVARDGEEGISAFAEKQRSRKPGQSSGIRRRLERGLRWRTMKAIVIAAIAECASAASAPSPRPAPDEIIFSHNTHLQAKLTCGTCHQTSYQADKPAADFRPKMAKCLECHAQWSTQNQCANCHTNVQFGVRVRGGPGR